MNCRTLIIFIYSLLFERDVVSPSALKVFYRFLTDLVRPSSAFKRHESTFLISPTLVLNRYNLKKNQFKESENHYLCYSSILSSSFWLLYNDQFLRISFLDPQVSQSFDHEKISPELGENYSEEVRTVKERKKQRGAKSFLQNVRAKIKGSV